MKQKSHAHKVDREVFSIVSLDDKTNDTLYWLSKAPSERFEALEHLRQIFYGYDPTSERLQRVLSIAELT